MRIPNSVHESHPWRIREIATDFTVEDVWALPAYGRAEDFPALLGLMTSFDPANGERGAARLLWLIRDRLGAWFRLGRVLAPSDAGADDAAARLPIPGTAETSLRSRLPEDLRNTAADIDFGSLPFTPLYRTDDEFAAELSNQTVHGILHVGWARQGDGVYQGQLAVYVKPRGRLGGMYLAFIKPFRYAVVYPAIMRRIEQTWNSRVPQ